MSTFKKIRKSGKEALRRQVTQDRRHKNRANEDVEKLIIDFSLQNPHLGQAQVSAQITVTYGMEISPNGVRQIWLREKMNTSALRIERANKLLTNK